MIDILTAAIFIIFIWRGYKNGFLKSAYRVAAFILSIILAYALYPYIKNIIMYSSIGSAIGSVIQTKYVEPGLAGNLLSESSLPGYMQSMVANGQIVVEDALTGFISNLVINIISFISVFIVVRLLIFIIGKLFDIMSRLPVIRFFNRGMGVIFGICESILIIYLILALVYAVTPLRQNPLTQKYISESTLTKNMYENNPIVTLVSPTDYDNLSLGGE